jgi:hypothetical protein
MIYNIEILYEVSTVPLVKPGLLAFSYSLLSQYLVSLAPPPKKIPWPSRKLFWVIYSIIFMRIFFSLFDLQDCKFMKLM